MISGSDFKPFQPVLVGGREGEMKWSSFAYISLDAMIPQEADQTHIEYGFPVKWPGYSSSAQAYSATLTTGSPSRLVLHVMIEKCYVNVTRISYTRPS